MIALAHRRYYHLVGEFKKDITLKLEKVVSDRLGSWVKAQTVEHAPPGESLSLLLKLSVLLASDLCLSLRKEC